MHFYVLLRENSLQSTDTVANVEKVFSPDSLKSSSSFSIFSLKSLRISRYLPPSDLLSTKKVVIKLYNKAIRPLINGQ